MKTFLRDWGLTEGFGLFLMVGAALAFVWPVIGPGFYLAFGVPFHFFSDHWYGWFFLLIYPVVFSFGLLLVFLNTKVENNQ